ncbi:MAG: hypothetical protein HeimAB125_04570 [Candidatus Heimdallarchaeota archaeon AB_125]|nr:MAG: hypothetical protein HeimAB125_04570 [Candidatus Heimdallarchaeota archaeon AB_125]
MQIDNYIDEDFLLEDEIEEIFQIGEKTHQKLPFIEFKDHIEEDLSNYRFTFFFCLLFAIIGAISLAFVAPIIALMIGQARIVEGGIIENYRWSNPIIGGLIGAMFGAFIGWIIESLLYSFSSDKTQKV